MMLGTKKWPVAVAALLLSASSARAGYIVKLTSNARAASTGGCPECQTEQDQTVMNPVGPLTSVATSLDGASFAHAYAKTDFGTQHVYADAFLTAGDVHPDAQSQALSSYTEYFAPGALGGLANINFVISGSITPNGGAAEAPDAELSWTVADVSAPRLIGFGNWYNTDASWTVSASYAVPLTDVIEIVVGFHAGAYSGQEENPKPVVADFSHTVHTYISSGDGNADVIGMSGHDYAEPATGSVPEPASWSLMMLGLGGLGVAQRRRQTRPGAIAG